jgi:hypothetical protein
MSNDNNSKQSWSSLAMSLVNKWRTTSMKRCLKPLLIFAAVVAILSIAAGELHRPDCVCDHQPIRCGNYCDLGPK